MNILPATLPPVDKAPPRLYAIPDILLRGNFSKSHLYNLMARGQFPLPSLRCGPRFTRWSASEVDDWLADPQSYVNAHAVTEAPT